MDLKEASLYSARHPWELSRCMNIKCTFFHHMADLLKHKKEKNEITKIADIGAGDLYFSHSLLADMKKKGLSAEIYAVDNHYKDEGKRANIYCYKDIEELEPESMDCIFLMDVLEHIQDDKKFLQIAGEKLKDTGIIILTVPAFNRLYSDHDRFLEHYRRYEYHTLQKIIPQKLSIVQSNYFYSILFFVRCIQVKFMHGKRKKNLSVNGWKYSAQNILTRIVKLILNIDFSLNQLSAKFGLCLPGLSLLVVMEKRK